MNATAQNITAYLQGSREIHRQLNSEGYPDVDADDQALRDEFAALRNENEKFWTRDADFLSAHDAHIQNLSERRAGNSRTASFSLNAFVYDMHTQKEANGYQPVHFKIEGAEKLRELNGKEIYDVMVCESGKAIGFLYHQPGQNMKILVTEYASLERTYGEFFTPPRRGMKM